MTTKRSRARGASVLVVCVASLLGMATPIARASLIADINGNPTGGVTPQADVWQQYHYTFSAVLSNTFLTFLFRNDPSYTALDDISLAAAGSATNLLQNGGLNIEATTNGPNGPLPANWSSVGTPGLSAAGVWTSGSPGNPPGASHSGAGFWEDGAVGGYDGLGQGVATTIGQSYDLSFWLGGNPIPNGTTVDTQIYVGALPPGYIITGGASNITTSQPYYLASNLGTSVNPDFQGGTLRIDQSNGNYSQNFVLDGSGTNTIDQNGNGSTFSGVFSDSGPGVHGGITITDGGVGGSVTFTGINTYTGGTTINSGAMLALRGSGSIADSSGVADNGTFDISSTTAGASISSLSGTGAVILGSQNLHLTNAAGDFAGSIAGGGSLIVAGGTQTLSGTNTYTGGTTISAGTLQLGSGGATGSIAGNVTDNGTLAFDHSNSVTFGGVISGSGQLIQLGGGTLTLTGINNFTGGTTISAGTLEVGDINAPAAVLGGDVIVALGGMLRGHGIISGNVASVGTVFPGGSIGILTVTGNYTQGPSGTLSIEVTPSAIPGIGYDQLQVHGSASLAGRLLVLVDPGNYVVGTRYDILHAGGGVSGTFGSVAYNPAFTGYITPLVSYDPSNAYLTLDPTPAMFNGGQEAADTQTAIADAVAGVGDAVLADSCGAAARQGPAPQNGCVVHPLTNSLRSEIWLRSLGGIGNLTGSSPRMSFTDNYAGMLIGYGIGFGHFTVGLGGGFLASGLNFSDGGSASQDAELGFVYGGYEQGPLGIRAMAAYGGGRVNGVRVVPGTGLAASGGRNGAFGIVAMRATYDLPLGAYTLEPRAGVAYIHVGQGGFTETGASFLDLAYGSLSTNESDGRVGVRLSRSFAVRGWHLTPWIEPGVQETFSGLSRTTTVAAGLFSDSVAGISPSPTAGTVAVGIRLAATKHLDGFLRYQGLFSADQVASAFSASMRYRF